MKIISSLVFIVLALTIIKCSSNSDRQRHFNELAGSPEWQPDKIIHSLAIKKGWNVGDLGAGGGYYTYRFAEETGDSGQVFAADINQEFLTGIGKTAAKKGLTNITTVLASVDDSNFRESSLDLIFIRNTFHHIDNKNQYMQKLSSKLKADGRIAVIDYKDSGTFWLFGHSVTREDILSSISDTNLHIEHEYEFLEKQYFFMLKKQKTSDE